MSCHTDIIDWLNPDWIYDVGEQRFAWRELQRRPPIELEIRRVPTSMWDRFSSHHYLTADINRTATCFAAYYRDQPVAFDAWPSSAS